MFDYSLFFVSCLHDYYLETKDREVLYDLWETAYKQIEISSRFMDDNMLVTDRDTWWCFIDWNDKLNKQASAHAVCIYVLKQAIKLSEICGNASQTEHYRSADTRLVRQCA